MVDAYIKLTDELSAQAHRHPFAAAGLIVALAVILALLVDSIINVSQTGDSFVLYALAGGTVGFVATTLGAVPALVLRKVKQSTTDIMLGFAAGMMLAAAAFSLLLPGIEAGQEITGSPALSSLMVVGGMGLGVLLMFGLDRFMPHEHETAGVHGVGSDRLSRVWLFVMAMALHNLPEGMAVGVGFSQGDMSVGVPLATAIALQDIPEGLAVALALIAIGVKPLASIGIAALGGFLEPVGALIGVGLSSGSLYSYPIGLGIAGGAMLFVVSHEVIPETHRNGNQSLATTGLMAGFALMMVLDTTLG
ncbi:ZIP family metal transporter [Salinibius halmophilus]|uniref:ZIP family metal transporter n=1 Tax=Salinibius halmophilus TaxID=1853216 RepID=UPI000E66A194|nr:ZIP family metal transporter [Salinibius halmophilus]